MLRKQRRAYLPLIGVALLGALAGMYLFALKRFSKPDGSDAVKGHKVETSPDKALEYWTADKKRRAKPAPMPKVKTAGRKKKQTPQSSQDTQLPQA